MSSKQEQPIIVEVGPGGMYERTITGIDRSCTSMTSPRAIIVEPPPNTYEKENEKYKNIARKHGIMIAEADIYANYWPTEELGEEKAGLTTLVNVTNNPLDARRDKIDCSQQLASFLREGTYPQGQVLFVTNGRNYGIPLREIREDMEKAGFRTLLDDYDPSLSSIKMSAREMAASSDCDSQHHKLIPTKRLKAIEPGLQKLDILDPALKEGLRLHAEDEGIWLLFKRER